jgi:phospholipid/cholesterol/gamma-HCH transport system substrate-binding protein
MTGSLRSVILKLSIFTIVTLSLTALLGMVIGNIQPFTRFYDVSAEFSDATGLLNTDVVKIAGVNVGKVKGSQVVIDKGTGRAKALVTLRIRKDVDVPSNARAAIRFRNLLGQRMIAITRAQGEQAAPLRRDGKAVIPLRQTSPAFDLGIVFNNLRPVLRTLNPDDVNTVSRALLQIFGGREKRVQQMVSDLADVAESLGARGAVVTELVDNLSGVVKSVAGRDDELRSVIDSLDAIAASLSGKGDELARALDNLGVASEGTAEIVANNRPELDRTIDQLRQILAIVAAHKQDLDVAVRQLPGTVYALNRATTYGTWVNLSAVCINDICGPGFTSTSNARSRENAAAGLEGVADVLMGAAR